MSWQAYQMYIALMRCYWFSQNFPVSLMTFCLSALQIIFIKNRNNYYYLVIEDEAIPVNIPYGVLFFPDRSITNCISDKGFFLSEYYTVLRSTSANESNLKNNIDSHIINRRLSRFTKRRATYIGLF